MLLPTSCKPSTSRTRRKGRDDDQESAIGRGHHSAPPPPGSSQPDSLLGQGRQVEGGVRSRRSPTSLTIGFTAVKADVPRRHDRRPSTAPGSGQLRTQPRHSACSAPRSTRPSTSSTRSNGRSAFAADQVELGLDRDDDLLDRPCRPGMAEPAVGADFNANQLPLAIENCDRSSCQVLQSPGPPTPAPLAHRWRLRNRAGDHPAPRHPSAPHVIGFGPDTGHLRWAGIDPARPHHPLRRPDRRHPHQGRLPRLPPPRPAAKASATAR